MLSSMRGLKPNVWKRWTLRGWYSLFLFISTSLLAFLSTDISWDYWEDDKSVKFCRLFYFSSVKLFIQWLCLMYAFPLSVSQSGYGVRNLMRNILEAVLNFLRTLSLQCCPTMWDDFTAFSRTKVQWLHSRCMWHEYCVLSCDSRTRVCKRARH